MTRIESNNRISSIQHSVQGAQSLPKPRSMDRSTIMSASLDSTSIWYRVKACFTSLYRCIASLFSRRSASTIEVRQAPPSFQSLSMEKRGRIMIADLLRGLARKAGCTPANSPMAIVFKLNNKLIGSYTDSVWCEEPNERLQEKVVRKLVQILDPNVVDTIGTLSIDIIVAQDVGGAGEKFDLYTAKESESGLSCAGSAARQSKSTAAHVVLTHLGDRPNPDLVAPIFLALNIERRAN